MNQRVFNLLRYRLRVDLVKKQVRIAQNWTKLGWKNGNLADFELFMSSLTSSNSSSEAGSYHAYEGDYM